MLIYGGILNLKNSASRCCCDYFKISRQKLQNWYQNPLNMWHGSDSFVGDSKNLGAAMKFLHDLSLLNHEILTHDDSPKFSFVFFAWKENSKVL